MEHDVLAGKVAVITGASSGIGAAVAEALAGVGAQVVLGARRVDRLEEVAARIRDAGGSARVQATDVTVPGDLQALADETVSAHGRIDILVNNAGVMLVSEMDALKMDEWTTMVDVNVKGVLHGLGAVLPVMLRQGSGHIVNVSSVAGRRPFPTGAVYAATKFAVRALSWGLHLELGAKHGIRVTDIQPGVVSTELFDHISVPELRAGYADGWIERRPLRPEDVARAVLFAVTAPEHMAVSEVLVRPTDQPT